MAIKQPSDKSHFILPDLGEGLEEAELIKWRVKPGEKVAEHQTLAEMETDKALVEVPSPWAGVIRELHGAEGDTIKVGAVLVSYEAGSGARATAAGAAGTGASKASAAGDRPATGSRVAVAEPDESVREDAGTVVGSVGGTMRISTALTRRREDSAASAPAGRALATPAVRRIARDAGVDINRVPGSGRGGRVTAGDVQSFIGQDTVDRGSAAPSRGGAAAADAAPVLISTDDVSERIPFRGVRRKIAASLTRAVQTAVHFTCTEEADVTQLDVKRREYARVLGTKLSFLPFVVLAVCRSLRAHPSLNANVDDANGEILRKSVVNLGVAVDTDHGLMVPVIHDCARLSLVAVAEVVGTLAAGCRDRSIAREKLIGGTFTISNVGSYGGLFATPIINYPEVGILALGRVYEKVLVRSGAFYAGRVMPLSISCDHRVVDGAEAARFLGTLRTLLESPDQLLG